MPVSLQQFFNSANTVGDSASLFLQNGGESVGDTSSLHGIHKLSRSAKAEENRATVTAFLNALDQSPQFRNINADIRGMLNAKLEGGKPLTAEDVKLVRDSVLYDEALAAGRQLADGNALPAGHATSFAQRRGDMRLSACASSSAFSSETRGLSSFLPSDLRSASRAFLSMEPSFPSTSSRERPVASASSESVGSSG